ncbi:MAG: SpoIIE family protein phosphatase [Terriglobales bacterium]|jgi:sigma-B regulation protein RsbU (phosphoserine phosphatase)
MRLVSLEVESKLREKGLWPQSWVARAALYVVALELLLFAVQLLTRRVRPAISGSLEGWVDFLSVLALVLFGIAGFRRLRSKLLWRLRNRLIVTYVFIGVIPIFLLVVISLITLYLLAGQFASFVVTSDITTHLRSMEAANRAVAHHLATQIADGGKLSAETLSRARPHRPEWARRQVCAWYQNQPRPFCSGPEGAAGFDSPSFITEDFRDVVRDHGALYLRTATVLSADPGYLRVIVSEPFDKEFVENIARDLGRIVVYGTEAPTVQPVTAAEPGGSKSLSLSSFPTFDDGNQPQRVFSAGTLPQASSAFDHEVTLRIPLQVVDWAAGAQRYGAIAEVETRPSVISTKLFAARGDYAEGLKSILKLVMSVFVIVVLLALFVGWKLTRSITSAVGQLYDATKHINRADFSHRITVQSSDQLATLANSFNSMTTSIEKLVEEQKEKQRLEGELAIAQEVQAQLYPKLITQLETLEVHGFCLPARTVSGDYYDFLALNSDKLLLAVGDISGKGISAALLMATIYSAVRAYSIEDVPALRELATHELSTREPVALAAGGSGLMLVAESRGPDTSPATLLTLLNHQLYESTPAAKYATLFLGIYDGATRRLIYANGGHLPPILISEDGSSQLLSCGGTVVGLFDNLSFPEATVQLRPGDVLLVYTDGVTEPENDYGEFGEERLIQLVRANRHLPLERITEIVAAAVADWIGDNEQPDDITLVLARAR